MPLKPIQRRLLTLGMVSLLLAGCAGPAPRSSTGRPPDPAAATALNPVRHQIVSQVLRLLGTPYRYGGNDLRGFDCSGLVQYTYNNAGIAVPRTAADQQRTARPVGLTGLLPGDLVFFDVEGKDHHVGIYVGEGAFIHAPSSGKQVSQAYLDSPYWRDRLITAGTYL